MYLSLSLTLQDIAIAATLFFASLLTLTYSSRLLDARLSWTLISPLLMVAVWGLGNNRQASLATLICTLTGAILPVFALLVPYSGLTLSLAALLSGAWLVVKHWYGGIKN